MKKETKFESSVNSYDSQTFKVASYRNDGFESSVNSYDSQTLQIKKEGSKQFESSVNSYDSQTIEKFFHSAVSLRVV